MVKKSNAHDGMAAGPEGDQPMSFFEHLAELRRRLIHAAIGVVAAFALCWFFVLELQTLIHLPLADAWREVGLAGQPRVQTLGVLDSFLTQVRIAVTAAIFLAGPILFYQLWMFVAPGLYANEKRLVVPFAITSAVMFLLGAAFCYVAVLPYATRWFLEYPMTQADASGVAVVPQYTFPDYTKYTTKLLVGFGIMFELPLAVFFLAKAGIITHLTLIRYWKISVMAIVVASAFLTPPDPITLVFMAVPMLVLFAASIGVAYLVSKPQLAALAELDAELEREAAADSEDSDAQPDTASDHDDGAGRP